MVPPRIAIAVFVALGVASVDAMECTPPPPTAPRDYQGEIDFAVARVLSIRGPGATVAVQSQAKNLLEKIPNADKALIELTYLFTLCTALRDDRSIPEAEKGRLIAGYGRSARPISPDSPPKADREKPSRTPVAPPAQLPGATKQIMTIQGNTGTTVGGNDVKGDMNITTTEGQR